MRNAVSQLTSAQKMVFLGAAVVDIAIMVGLARFIVA